MALFDIRSKEGQPFDYSAHYDVVLCAVGVEHFMEECPFNILLICSFLELKGFKVATMVVSRSNNENLFTIMKRLSDCCDNIGFTLNDENYPEAIDSVNYLQDELEYYNVAIGGILVNYDYKYLARDITQFNKVRISFGEGCKEWYNYLSGKQMKGNVDIANIRFNRDLMYKDEERCYYTDQNMLSFGCAWNSCNMCGSKAKGLCEHIVRNFDIVISEDEELALMGSRKIHHICSCAYIDDFIPFYKKWNENAILADVMHRGSDILMRANKIYDYIQDTCYSIEYGLEHGSDHMLKVLNKSHSSVEQIKKHIQLISKYDKILYRFYFVIGHPAETEDDLKQLLELFKYITNVLENRRFKFIAFPYFPHTHLKKHLEEFYGSDSYDLFNPTEDLWYVKEGKFSLWREECGGKYLELLDKVYHYCDNHNYPQGRAIKHRREELM